MKQIDFHITENSLLARIAAKKMGAPGAAMVLGKTIHLYNITREDFLQNEKLLKHELCHVHQYQQHGFTGFILKYLWESIWKGYYHNKFEVAARKAEAE